MFITAIQNAIKRELFRGSMHRGKYRYVRPIKAKEMKLLREEYMREERVTQLLLNPYLTLVNKTHDFQMNLRRYHRSISI